VNDEPTALKILSLRGQIAELGVVPFGSFSSPEWTARRLNCCFLASERNSNV